MKDLEAIPHIPEADTLQIHVALGNLAQAVRARRWVVFATTLLTLGLVVAYIWIWPPTFQAEVMIAAESDKDLQRAAFYQGWNVFRRDGLTDEGVLMTSGPALKEVARRLGLTYDDVYHPFMSHLTHLWGESWVGKTYRKLKYWIFPKKPNPYEPSPEEVETYKLMSDFREGVKVQQVKDAAMGLLIVRGSSYRVAEIANTIADLYLEQRRERFVREAQRAYESLREEADKAWQELQAVNQEIQDFQAKNGMLLLFEKDRVQIGQWQAQRQAVADIEAAIAENESALKSVERQIALESEFIGSDRVFKDTALHDRLTKLEMQLAHARQLFQPTSPEVVELEEQIRIAKAGIGESQGSVVVRNSQRASDSYESLRARKMALETMLAGSQASLPVKKAELERVRILLDQIPAKMKINQEYERKLTVLDGKYRTLNDKLAVATVSVATARSAPPAFRVVDYATAPEKPTWPNTKLFIIGAVLAGLAGGVIAALLLELVFKRVNRHRLGEKGADYSVFAIVGEDEKFLERLYPREAQRRLLAGSSKP